MMVETKRKSAIERVMDILPDRLSEEIKRLAIGRRGGLSKIREIRIRCRGACSLIIGNESIRLYRSIDKDETDALMSRLIGGALYAHRESIASGCICTLPRP